MKLIDLTHTLTRQTDAERLPVVVRSVDPIHLVPLERLVTMATVLDLTARADRASVTRADVAGGVLPGIAGCVIRTGWADAHLAGTAEDAPRLDVAAAGALLEAGVRTVAADFPILGSGADLLLHNNCVLVYCLSSTAALQEKIVRLIALPLKFEDTFSADARVVAIEE